MVSPVPLITNQSVGAQLCPPDIYLVSGNDSHHLTWFMLKSKANKFPDIIPLKAVLWIQNYYFLYPNLDSSLALISDPDSDPNLGV